MTQKKYSSSLSRQSSETIKTKHKIGLGKPGTIAAYLEFNKPNKQNVYKIKLLINSTFLSLKIIVETLIDVRSDTSKHHFLKSVKINT